MNREDIIRMAQEAAIMPPHWGATEAQWRSLEAFAELVEEAERKPWVGLTEEEAADCWSTSAVNTWQAIEAKLRSKNT